MSGIVTSHTGRKTLGNGFRTSPATFLHKCGCTQCGCIWPGDTDAEPAAMKDWVDVTFAGVIPCGGVGVCFPINFIGGGTVYLKWLVFNLNGTYRLRPNLSGPTGEPCFFVFIDSGPSILSANIYIDPACTTLLSTHTGLIIGIGFDTSPANPFSLVANTVTDSDLITLAVFIQSTSNPIDCAKGETLTNFYDATLCATGGGLTGLFVVATGGTASYVPNGCNPP